jgi:predicted phage tail protein
LFSETSYRVDLVRYADVLSYLTSMHRKFRNYVKGCQIGLVEETFCLLDKNLELISQNDLFIKKIKKDDCFYVVPVIVGAGGKNGMRNLVIAAALIAATGPAGAGLWGTGGAAAGTAGTAAASSASVMGTAAEAQFMGQVGAQTAGGFTLGSFGTTLAVNAGLALATSLFTKKPADIKRTDQNARQNNMFGSLKNTVDSGIPIPLIYGLHRVGGQFISGYLDTTKHDSSANIKVSDKFS